MSGISGFFAKGKLSVSGGRKKLETMNFLQKHRGNAGDLLLADDDHWGFACIFDGGRQKSRVGRADNGNAVCFSGMLTNVSELRRELGAAFPDKNGGDAELVLACMKLWSFPANQPPEEYLLYL